MASAPLIIKFCESKILDTFASLGPSRARQARHQMWDRFAKICCPPLVLASILCIIPEPYLTLHDDTTYLYLWLHDLCPCLSLIHLGYIVSTSAVDIWWWVLKIHARIFRVSDFELFGLLEGLNTLEYFWSIMITSNSAYGYYMQEPSQSILYSSNNSTDPSVSIANPIEDKMRQSLRRIVHDPIEDFGNNSDSC